MPPGKNMDDYTTMFRSGMWRLRYQLSAEGAHRFFQEFLPKLHESKAAALGKDDDNSWYLVYIGTKPGAQKNGYAKALIEMVTQQVSVRSLIVTDCACGRTTARYDVAKLFNLPEYRPTPKA